MSIQDVGDNARRLMKIRGLSIPELSQNMGMGTATVSNLLNGKTEPKSSTLIKLAESLGVPLNQLLSDAPSLSSLRFRTLKTLSGREKAEREQLRHDTALWLANYVFLENTLSNHPPRVLDAVEERDPASAAAAVRKALGLGPTNRSTISPVW